MTRVQEAASVGEGDVQQIVLLALREVIRKLDCGVRGRAAEDDGVVIPQRIPRGVCRLDDPPASAAKRSARLREGDLEDRTRKLGVDPPVARRPRLFDIDTYGVARSRRAAAEEESNAGNDGSIHLYFDQ